MMLDTSCRMSERNASDIRNVFRKERYDIAQRRFIDLTRPHRINKRKMIKPRSR